MFNCTILTLIINSDLALVSIPVKTLLIVGQKARESSDTSMSTCDGVGYIPWHWKINKTTHRMMYIMCGSRWGTGGPDPLESHKNIGFLAILVPIPLKS